MSYRPPTSGGNYPPPGYRPPGEPAYVSPAAVRTGRRRNIPWFAGCSLVLLGFVLGIVGLLLGLLLIFGSPVSSEPLPNRQPVAGTTDLAATLSEAYLNAEILRSVKSNAPSIAGIVSLKDINVKILPNQQLQVDARLGNALVDFDVSMVESLGIQNGQVVVKAVGEPKVGKGNLPISVNAVVQAINNLVVQPQINQQVANISVNGRTLKLVDLETSNQLITVRYNAQ